MAGFRKREAAPFVPPIVVREFKADEFKGGKSVMRTVRWYYQGKPGAPKFEKRKFFQKEEGFQMSNAEGLTLADLSFISDHWDEIIASMNGTTATSAPAQADKPAHQDDPFS